MLTSYVKKMHYDTFVTPFYDIGQIGIVCSTKDLFEAKYNFF